MDVQSLRGAIYSLCSILVPTSEEILPKKEEEKRICLQLSSTAVFKRSSNGEFVDLLFWDIWRWDMWCQRVCNSRGLSFWWSVETSFERALLKGGGTKVLALERSAEAVRIEHSRGRQLTELRSWSCHSGGGDELGRMRNRCFVVIQILYLALPRAAYNKQNSLCQAWPREITKLLTDLRVFNALDLPEVGHQCCCLVAWSTLRFYSFLKFC